MKYWADFHSLQGVSSLERTTILIPPSFHLWLISLNTTSRLWCAANSLTLRATRIGLTVRARPRAAVCHHRPRRWSSATLVIVAVLACKPATLSRPRQLRPPQHSQFTVQVACSASLQSAQTISRPMFPESKFLVSRPRPPAISARSETKLWWRQTSRTSSSRSRRSPKSSLLLALSSGVEAFGRRWAMGVAPSSVRAHTASQNRRSRSRGDETPCSAQHARTTH